MKPVKRIVGFKRPVLAYWCPECNKVIRAKSLDTIEIEFDNPDDGDISLEALDMDLAIDCYTCNGGMIQLDDKIADYIVQLNNIPGISTLYSCEGHLHVAPSIQNNKDLNISVDYPYIMFYDDCNNRSYNGYSVIEEIINKYANKKYIRLESGQKFGQFIIRSITPKFMLDIDHPLKPYDHDVYVKMRREMRNVRAAFFDIIKIIITRLEQEASMEEL